MAYALRLKIECSSITGDNAEILVYKEGYTGEAVTRAGGETPFQLKWGDGSKEMLPLVYGSQLTAAFILQTDFEFTDLFVTNARDIYIEIIVNETDKIWCGFIDPGNYTEQLIAPQFEVSFDAFDGLGLLKDEDFLNDNKTPYTGEYTLLALLQLILSKTGLSIPLNTRINFRPTEMSSAADMLTQVTKDVVTYTDMSCYEVLEAIFKNCRIFQRGGEWYILSNDVWAESSITCYAYTAAGAANGTKVISPAFEGWYIIDVGKMDMLPPLKQIKFSQDYGYKNNLLENSDFAEIDESGNFDAWTPVNIIPQQRVYDAEGNKYVYLPGVERLDPWQTENRTKYLQSDPLTVAAASDMFKISLGYALMGPKNNSAYIFFGMFLDGDDGTDYALEAYYYTETDLREVRYRWTVSSHKLAVPVAAHIKRSKVFLGPDTFTVEPDRIEAWPWDEVINNFKTAEITVEGGIPTSGIVTVYLFAAHTGGTVAGSCFREIKLMLTDETENEYTTSVANVLINNLRNNLVPDDLDFVNGDTPDIANRLTIYQGGFLLNDGSGEGTRLWKHDNIVNTFTFAELMTRFISSEIRTAKQKYELKLGNSNLGEVLVLTDADNDNRKFVESGITYTFHRAEIEGQFIELTELNLTDYSVVILKEEIATGNKSSSKNQALMADFDERAALIDPNDYNIEGQPGYFNSDDFEQIIDENTGRASTSFTWKLVTQTAHGLSAGNAIRHNGTTWVKAIADSTTNLATAIVRKVIDVDTFVYQSDGFYPDATFTPGTWNYLSGVTAGLVVTSPDAEIVQCLGFVTDRGWKIEISSSVKPFDIPSLPPKTTALFAHDLFAFFDISTGVHRKITLSELEDYLILEGFLPEAPEDGNTYGRKDGTWVAVSGGGTTDHAALTNLDYAVSGHTGFVSVATAQTISGAKTFSSNPKISNASEAYISAKSTGASTNYTGFIIYDQSNVYQAQLGYDNLHNTSYVYAKDFLEIAVGTISLYPNEATIARFTTEALWLKDIATTPATPSAGFGGFYVKTDKPYFISDSGTEYDLTATGSLSETDPVFTASAAAGITTTNITNWNTAYGWGNHATAGYLTSFSETDPVFTASAAAGITATNISNWNTAYGWGNHATAGYISSLGATTYGGLAKDASNNFRMSYLNTGSGTLTLSHYFFATKSNTSVESYTIAQLAALIASTTWISDTNGIHYNNNVGIGVNSNSLYKLVVNTSIATTGSTAVKGENTAAVTNAFGVVAAVTAGLEGSAGVYGYNTSSTTSLHYGGFFNAQNGSNGIGIWAIGGLCAARFGSSIQLQELSSVATPASGYGALYVKTDGKLYFKNDAGKETALT